MATGVVNRPATEKPRATATQLLARIRRLGRTQREIAARLGVPQYTLNNLLRGKALTAAQLGYDQWPTYVDALLDGYEVALPLLQERAQAIAAEFEERGLPIPAQLAACLPAERRGRRKGGK